jgi:hypothetical protein
MILKTFTLIGGMFGAAIFSQFPEFTQQYMQRMGGQIDALDVVLKDFDASADKASMTREQALASMGGTTFLENRRTDMRKTITRFEGLLNDRQQLSNASPLQRLIMPQHMRDGALGKATYDDFRPALPLSVEGAVSAGGGYVAGWSLIAAFLHFLKWPFRRRSKLKPV